MCAHRISIEELKPPLVSQYYSGNSAAIVCSSLEGFRQYLGNFVGACAVLDPSCREGPLSLECPLTVSPPGAGAGGAGSGPRSRLTVRLTFPPAYPQQLLAARLVLPQGSPERIRQPYAVMDAEGAVQLECLSFLRGVERPYALLDVLLALTEQFELEYPLVGPGEASPPSRPPAGGGDAARTDVGQALAAAGTNPQRATLIQDAAEKVVIDLNEKAKRYLDTREHSLMYLQKLNESNRELNKAKDVLEKHKADMKKYIPKVGSGAQVLAQMQATLRDTPEDHVACISAEDPLQEQAFELMAAGRANIETLALLEEALKREVLDCEGYIKAVAAVGRRDFVTTFLYRQVFQQLSKADSAAAATAPNVPTRLTPEQALLQEFPNAGADLIRDVLASCNNDVGVARQQLRAMFP